MTTYNDVDDFPKAAARLALIADRELKGALDYIAKAGFFKRFFAKLDAVLVGKAALMITEPVKAHGMALIRDAGAAEQYCRKVLRDVHNLVMQSVAEERKTKSDRLLLRFYEQVCESIAPMLTRETFFQCVHGDQWRLAIELEDHGI